jgi:hypothetical protein
MLSAARELEGNAATRTGSPFMQSQQTLRHYPAEAGVAQLTPETRNALTIAVNLVCGVNFNS